MKSSPSRQWFGFACAITVLAAVIGLIGHSTWKNLHDLRNELKTLQAESFHMADHLEASMRDLNDTILRYEAHHSPAERQRFEKRTTELETWITAQLSSVNTDRERNLLKQIIAALREYRTQIAPLLETQPNQPSLTAELLDALEQRSAPYLGLCRQFDEAQQWSLGQFGQQSHRTAALLQRLLICGAILLLAFWAIVARLLYRTMVAPLRAKLVETRSIVERQEKLASLGTLAAGVAHEIRNPLTAIKVRLHSMKKMLRSGSSEQEDAVVIGDEIQRLERIVKDFLQFARPSEPQFIVTTAEAVLQHIHELFRAQFEASGIEIKLEPTPHLEIRVDTQQVEQVLINLVQNAAESIEHRGTITLRGFATRAQLQGRLQPAAALEVSDTGKGIPADVQKRLFDPFFTTKATGNGLGLSIAARIVESHGGALQYQTELNRGTVFRVLLPAVQDES